MARAPRAKGGERAAVDRAAAALRERAGGPLDAVCILGSGIAGPTLEGAVRLPLEEIPGLPAPSVEGHAASASVGSIAGLRVLVLEGRVHLYEGRTPAEVVRAVRAAGAAGARLLLATSAAGGVASWMKPGDLLVLADHLDLGRGDPAAGEEDAFGPRFVPMAGAYDPALRLAGLAAARAARATAAEGVYAFVRGPAYETAAEVRMLRAMGADAAGMSTVPEVIAARRLGMRAFGLSVIANLAGGPGDDHREVLARVRSRSAAVTASLDAVLAAFAGGDRG